MGPSLWFADHGYSHWPCSDNPRKSGDRFPYWVERQLRSQSCWGWMSERWCQRWEDQGNTRDLAHRHRPWQQRPPGYTQSLLLSARASPFHSIPVLDLRLDSQEWGQCLSWIGDGAVAKMSKKLQWTFKLNTWPYVWSLQTWCQFLLCILPGIRAPDVLCMKKFCKSGMPCVCVYVCVFVCPCVSM